VIKNCICSNLN